MKLSLLTYISLFCTLSYANAQVKPTATKAVLNHVALYVYNLNISSAFYKEVIGLDTVPEPFHDGKHTWFQLSEHGHLHIISGNIKEQQHIKDAHLCFSVPSVDSFIMKLQKAGVHYESWTGEPGKPTVRVDGVKQVYFQDPDGYWLEVNDAK